MAMHPIYLDNNATTPVDPEVLASMLPYYTQHFGNAASRSHSYGWVAEEAVQVAREQVAALIGALPEEIIFTSGATESVNLAVKGTVEAYAGQKHIITCKTEHNAVLDTCRQLEKKGVAISYLPVDVNGLVDLLELENAIRPETILISIMYANNETGVLQDIENISAIARRHNIWFFTDATQAVGKVPVNVLSEGIDLLSLSAHKIYGPKGVGALFVRKKNPRVKIVAQIDGGAHEKGFRSGTLNVPGIVGLGAASALCQTNLLTESHRIGQLREKLEQGLTGAVSINGIHAPRIPNTSSISFAGIAGNKMLTELSKSMAVSSGSACTSANPSPSHVLKAMQIPDDLIKNTIRFGLGRFTTEEEIDFCIAQTNKVHQILLS